MTANSTLPAPTLPIRTADSDADVPLVVDVDGTLIKTDLLFEAALQMVARHPFQLWRVLVWLTRGKTALKAGLAGFGDPGIANLPLREEAVEAIRAAQSARRRVYLASASHRYFVETLAERIGGISGVFATDAAVNLAGAAKADRLVTEFGLRKFDYLADADVDFAIWSVARKVLAVTHSAGFERRLVRSFPQTEIIARPRSRVNDSLKAIRPHQWSKNVLVFLPLVAGHFFAPTQMFAAMLAFIAFSMTASSAYLINDLLDLPSDRDHPRKRRRPLASGAVSLKLAMTVAAVLVLAGFTVALTLPARFVVVLALYFVATLAYSVILKRKIVVDVVTLAGLYTVRVLGGIAAVGATSSQWLLMFSLFLFLGLAIVKRCSELIAREQEGTRAPLGRGYRAEDLRALFAFGAAAGYGAVFVVTLYLSSPEVQALYQHPNRLWLICPLLLYWITRIFMISNRGELNDDPLVFALTDRTSWATAVCAVCVLAIAM